MGEGAAVNVGDYLVQHSTLSSGTALAHLLALQAGTGRTVFASSFTVVIEEPQLFVNMSSNEMKQARQVSEVRSKPGKEIKRLFVTTTPEEITVTTYPNLLNIVEVKL